MKNTTTSNTTFGAMVYGATALWFTFALVMGIQGNYIASPANPPLPLALTFLVPIVFFVILYWTNSSLRAFSHMLDLKVITGMHLWRFVGLDFLMRYAQGDLPAGFALPAGIGDIIIALTTIPLLLAISRNTTTARKWFVAWN